MYQQLPRHRLPRRESGFADKGADDARGAGWKYQYEKVVNGQPQRDQHHECRHHQRDQAARAEEAEMYAGRGVDYADCGEGVQKKRGDAHGDERLQQDGGRSRQSS